MAKKKLYLVKREVWATNLVRSVEGKGVVYEVVLADEKYQKEDSKNVGFGRKEKLSTPSSIGS